jgi:hypothetical protein
MRYFFSDVLRTRLTLLAATAVLVTGCDTSAVGPQVAGPAFDHDPGTLGTPNSQLFQVCKAYSGGNGPAVTVDWSLDYDDDGVDASGQVTLADGDCQTVHTYDETNSNNGTQPQTVTVTEQAVAGYTTSWIRKQIDGAIPPNTITTSGTGNSVSGTMLSNPDRGFLVVFVNTLIPVGGGEGCTPGYYKNLKKHLFAWNDAGYSPAQSVSSVFSEAANAPYSHLGAATLHEGLSFQGGDTVAEKAEILLRAAIAAVLNADNPNVSYGFTSAGIIADVNAALASGDGATILALATTLDNENNEGCPLGNGNGVVG